MHSLRTALAATVFVSFFILLPISAQPAEVIIAWDANSEQDLEGYGIYFRRGSDGPPYEFYGYVAVKELEPSAGPAYVVGGLEQNVRYYLALTAYDSQGNESDFSAPVCVDIGIAVSECTNPSAESPGSSDPFAGPDASNALGSSSGGSSVSCFIQALGGKSRLIGWVRLLSAVCLAALIRCAWGLRPASSASAERPGFLNSPGRVSSP